MSQDRTISASFTINSYNLSVPGGHRGVGLGQWLFPIWFISHHLCHARYWVFICRMDRQWCHRPDTNLHYCRYVSGQNDISFVHHQFIYLSVLAGTGGSVSGNGSFDHGSSATISATPETGYSFAGWTGDGVTDPTQTSTTVDMSQDRTVSASFTINSYNLSVLAGTGVGHE